MDTFVELTCMDLLGEFKLQWTNEGKIKKLLPNSDIYYLRGRLFSRIANLCNISFVTLCKPVFL